jgi:hypothetical protein
MLFGEQWNIEFKNMVKINRVKTMVVIPFNKNRVGIVFPTLSQ